MADSSVYQYRLSCTSESGAEKYVWSVLKPTKCPDNASHTIDTNSITIVQEVSTKKVIVKEENVDTGGNFKAKGIAYDVVGSDEDTGSGAGIVHSIRSWIYPVNILGIWINITEDMIGDVVNLYVAPNTTIGVIGAAVAVDDITITCSSTVFNYIKVGYEVRITNGVFVDDLGEVTSVNSMTRQITTTHPSTHIYSQFSPTYVQMSVHMLHDCELGAVGRMPIGSTKIGASYVPAGLAIHAYYKNNTTTIADHAVKQKRMRTDIEYLY